MTQGRKTELVIQLTPEERKILESWQRSTAIRHGQARRARIILMLADRVPISQIAKTLAMSRGPIYTWARRFQERRLIGLEDRWGREPLPAYDRCASFCGNCLQEGHRQGRSLS